MNYYLFGEECLRILQNNKALKHGVREIPSYVCLRILQNNKALKRWIRGSI